MNRKITLRRDEKILSMLNGLFESFDGVQNIYFGDLILTNKRICVVSNKFINLEEILWFEDEDLRNIGHSIFIVGSQRLKVRWVLKGNLHHFMKTFQQLNVIA